VEEKGTEAAAPSIEKHNDVTICGSAGSAKGMGSYSKKALIRTGIDTEGRCDVSAPTAETLDSFGSLRTITACDIFPSEKNRGFDIATIHLLD
jgi:hypothetical protein